MRWHAFASSCPELAEFARDWIVDRHVLLLGFVRFRDDGRDVWRWRAGGPLRKDRLPV